jgi:hypothetical protein
MPTYDVTSYLKYINLQMAAEAFFTRPSDPPGQRSGEIKIDSNQKNTLTTGNDHNTKFTSVEADQFIAEGWTILDQISNTTTGFSGTLFQSKSGELVISFRSTEFVDDEVRDSIATNQLEIKEKGWAFGQIADMEQWCAKQQRVRT